MPVKLPQSYDTKDRPTNIKNTILLLARELKAYDRPEIKREVVKEVKQILGQ